MNRSFVPTWGSAVLYESWTQSAALWGRPSHGSLQPPRFQWVGPVKIISMTSEGRPPSILLRPGPFFTPTNCLHTHKHKHYKLLQSFKQAIVSIHNSDLFCCLHLRNLLAPWLCYTHNHKWLWDRFHHWSAEVESKIKWLDLVYVKLPKTSLNLTVWSFILCTLELHCEHVFCWYYRVWRQWCFRLIDVRSAASDRVQRSYYCRNTDMRMQAFYVVRLLQLFSTWLMLHSH